MQGFFASPLGTSHPQHIGLNYWNTCMWEESKCSLHSIPQRLAPTSALSEAENKNHQRVENEHFLVKKRNEAI